MNNVKSILKNHGGNLESDAIKDITKIGEFTGFCFYEESDGSTWILKDGQTSPTTHQFEVLVSSLRKRGRDVTVVTV